MSRGSQIAAFKAPARPTTSVFNPRVDLLQFGTPTFLWVAGDGNTPTIGPTLTLTGTVSQGTKIDLVAGGKLETESYTGTQRRCAASVVADPGPTDDVVAICCCLDGTAAASEYPFGTLDAGQRGFGFYYPAGNNSLIIVANSTVTTAPARVVTGADAQLNTVIIDRSGNSTIRQSTSTQGATVTPAGTIGHGNLCVGALASGVGGYTGDIAYVAVYIGNNIANDWGAARLQQLYNLAGVVP